jgi:hypothetical protein
VKYYQKKKRWNKVKVWITKLLINIFVIIGMIAVLNWSIGVFAEAAEFYIIKADGSEVSVTSVHVNTEEVKKSEQIHNVAEGEGGDITSSPSASQVELKAIADKIYTLESSNGKNDSCKQKGKFNGYGYMQSTYHWVCFNTKEEVEQEVIKWLEKQLKEKTVAQALCYYNEGVAKDNCKYYENYLTL